MKKALIVIDMQNDYFKNGTMELKAIDEVLIQINKLINYARIREYKIYFIQHFSLKKEAVFFVPNTKGVELHKDLDIQNDMIIEKNYPNSFRDTNLQNELKKENINELIICGAMTHMCIDTTIRAGFDLGYKIDLVSDGCTTKDLIFKEEIVKADQVQKSYLSALGSVFCTIKDTEYILDE